MNLKKQRTPPLWAVLGAPLIGVPLMVGLLALAAQKGDGQASEPVPVVVQEPIDTQDVGPDWGDDPEALEAEISAG
jgi:hypothetical protein